MTSHNGRRQEAGGIHYFRRFGVGCAAQRRGTEWPRERIFEAQRIFAAQRICARGARREAAGGSSAAMGFGSGSSIQMAAGQNVKWYAVRVGRQTGIFPTWEQAMQQVGGFEGAQMKEFERADAAGGIDRGLLQAKMWLRSGSAKPPPSSMPPPAPRPALAQQQENEPVQAMPSTRRFSPMLLDAFHFGFFGEKCAREAQAERWEEEEEAEAERSRRPVAGRATGALKRPALAEKVGARSSECLAATVKRKRPRAEEVGEPPSGDVYARTYQDRSSSHRHRSVLLS